MEIRNRISRIRWRVVLPWAGVLVALYALLGFAVVPALVRSKLPPAVSAKLHRPATLKGARFNPFTLTLTLEGLSIGDRNGSGSLLSFERMTANVEAISLFKGGVVLRQLELVAPSISIARLADGTYSVQDLVEELTKPKPDEKPTRFSVANITIARGSVDLDDRLKGTRHAVRDLQLGVPFVSNLPVDVEIFTEPYFSAKVNGAPFGLKGKTKPFAGSRETTVDIDLRDLDLPYYLGYLPGGTAWRVASGRLDTKLKVSFTQAKDGESALLLSGTGAVRELSLVDAGKAPLVGFARLDASLASADPFRRVVRLESLAVERPELWVVRDRAGGYPILEKLTGGARAVPAAPASEGKKAGERDWKVEVAKVAVSDGKVHWRDEHAAVPFEALLFPVRLAVSSLSTEAGKSSALELSGATDGGEAFEHKGSFTLSPQSAEGTVRVTGIPLRRYDPYVRDFVLFGFEEGTVGLSASYRWPVAGGTTALSDLSVDVEKVRARIRGEKEDFLRVPAASMKGTAIDPEKRVVTVGSLSLTGAFLRAVRRKDGTIDLASLVKEEGTGAAPAIARSAAGPAAPPRSAATPWVTRVSSLTLEKGSVTFVDESAPRPTTISFSPASLRAQGLSTAAGEKAKLSARVVLNGKGSVEVAGTVTTSPVGAELKTDVKGIDLTGFAGYVPERVDLRLTRGTLSGKGTTSVRESPGGGYSFDYSGEATSASFATVDPATSEDFLKWDSLHFGGMKATWNPLSFSAERLSVSDFYSRIELYPDGSLNLRRVFGLAPPAEVDDAAAAAAEAAEAASATAPKTAAKTAPQAAPPPVSPAVPAEPVPPVRIDAVTLQGGTIRVDDRFVKPNYRAEMIDVGGRISGLSSDQGTTAEVDLRGRLESSAPLEITGRLNPLAATAFADIKASFRDIDLVPMTPYFVKYAGYAVQKGRLTMNVEYRLNDRKLFAKNGFVVDQFTFGEKVDSPTATKLPVKLAVSLLKDTDGVIRLDVPISGSVDDPKFRVAPIVWKILGNILLKAVTSPFALLGRMFGGGQELSYVDFAPGLSSLDPAAIRTLESLAKALTSRPALKLEIEGRTDAVKDAEGLRQVLFQRKVKARKAEDLANKGTPPSSVDSVVVAKEEWPEYLKQAYRKESFPKPRTALGFVKDIPADEMEKLILANIQPTPDDLRQLSLARATAVKENLLGPGKVPADRVFLVEPAAAGPPKSGAVFTLK